MLKVQECINKGQDTDKQMELFIKDINSLHKSMAVSKAGGIVVSIAGSVGVVSGIIVGIATGDFGAGLSAVIGNRRCNYKDRRNLYLQLLFPLFLNNNYILSCLVFNGEFYSLYTYIIV